MVQQDLSQTSYLLRRILLLKMMQFIQHESESSRTAPKTMHDEEEMITLGLKFTDEPDVVQGGGGCWIESCNC